MDHQLGKLTGFVIDKGIHIAYGPKDNGVIEVSSSKFPKRAQWYVEATPSLKENDWADHLRGATIALDKRYPLRRGLCAVIVGDNVLDFRLTKFVYYNIDKKTSWIIRYYEAKPKKPSKLSVALIDNQDKVLEMEERPTTPKSNWCGPPIYYHTKQDAKIVGKRIQSGCGIDAPVSFHVWLYKQSDVYVMLMPESRFDIGNFESYECV